jgi:hypothetical protein
MSDSNNQAGTSAELTGGAGYTYEDAVVAYYLTALLREENAAGQTGCVTRVAIQQAAHSEPLDDIIIDTSVSDAARRLSLQVKRSLTISTAASNTDFRWIIQRALETRAKTDFRVGDDRYGFVVEHVSQAKFRSLNRLIEWAKSSPTGADFEARFAPNGAASKADKALREELHTLIAPTTSEQEADFYRHFVALRLDGFDEDAARYAETVNRLSDLLAADAAVQTGAALFSCLCHNARVGAGSAKIWTRPSLLHELKDNFQLRAVPSYAHDLTVIGELTAHALSDISAEIDGVHIQRNALIAGVHDRLATHRFVNISGLPGTGKSVVLRTVVDEMMTSGPVFVLKSDRLSGSDWRSFATDLGLQHRNATALLAEIGAVGHAVLCIDGIDRIKPSQRKIITDLLHTLENDPSLAHWKVLATSRDQGLEAFRAWIPVRFYRETGIGDVSVTYLNDAEAEDLAKAKPALRSLLFGAPAVREIARRPFFASVLADGFARAEMSGDMAPGSESELIAVWWRAGGHDSEEDTAFLRQRAFLDLAQAGASSLGKSIAVRNLAPETNQLIVALLRDHIVRWVEEGHTLSFRHDIFFEWAFFRLLIDAGTTWRQVLSAAGEPPLLARIVALLSQHVIARSLGWAENYRALEAAALRPQWKRAWLTGPPSNPQFLEHLHRFQSLLVEDDYLLFEKFLVWFQAEHTIPNPLVLNLPQADMDGASLVRMADLLGWPSDFATWKRVLGWVLAVGPSLPARLVPNVVELFKVWQNVFAGIRNDISERIIMLCGEWLINLERVTYRDHFSMNYRRWQELTDETRSALESSLRTTILRSAPSLPEHAIAILDRALANGHMRRKIYEELIGFSPILSTVAPEKLVMLARAELLETLPMDEIEQERRDSEQYYQLIKQIRDKREEERSEQEKRILAAPHVMKGIKTYDLEDLGIDQYHHAYFPPSPLHEPFGSLFRTAPDLARALVRDLANHAMEAWRQIHEINKPFRGTPIPLDLDFPWGRQRFWGEWRVYNWFKGELAPQPLECAFLALSHWAHQELDAGHHVDEIIKDVIEGHECWAVLGIAVSLALETMHASETVLPLATCQRLWHVDLARMAQENVGEIDLFGLNVNQRLSADKAAALSYLGGRKSRFREVRNLAVVFALHKDERLRERFKLALEAFPDQLPYFFEEERDSEGHMQSLRETAQIWAGWGNAEHYRASDLPEHPGRKIIEYQAPEPLTDTVKERLATNTRNLQDYSVMTWAMKSLAAGALEPSIDLTAALDHVRSRETPGLFDAIAKSELLARQSAISATAALVARFGGVSDNDTDWAWNALARVEMMAEPEGSRAGSHNPWHPGLHLVGALCHDLRQDEPREGSAERLLRLALHPHSQVAASALIALLSLHDRDRCLTWIAAGLASDLFITHAAAIDDVGTRDTSDNDVARNTALETALARYAARQIEPLTAPPSAWVYAPPRHRLSTYRHREEPVWREPDVFFNHYVAEGIVGAFPVEVWCASSEFMHLFLSYLDQLTVWTASNLDPDWRNSDDRRHRHDRTNLNHWPMRLADLIARAATYLPSDIVINRYLRPFSEARDDVGLDFIAHFAEMATCRHIYDAETVSDGTLALLDHCLERLLSDRSFAPGSYRAGEVHGFDLPRLIKSLFFVSVEGASGARRFANGDWTDLPRVMPLIDKLVRQAGWARFVMDMFLTLCERAGTAYPIDVFANQVTAALNALRTARASWTGLMHAARLSGMVQVLADANYPLTADQSRGLLFVLDSLIDLGDRRSAALEQSEAFRNTQNPENETTGGNCD